MSHEDGKRRPGNPDGAIPTTAASGDAKHIRPVCPTCLDVKGPRESFTDAFEHGYRLGYGAGWDGGWLHGRDDERTSWTKIIGAYRETITSPSQVELARVRATLRACRCGRCSTCARLAAMRHNLRVFGTADYPGVQRAAQLRKRVTA